MSLSASEVLDMLVQYGEHNLPAFFAATVFSLQEHFLKTPNQKTMKIPLKTSVLVANNFLAEIAKHDKMGGAVLGWQCLSIICDASYNDCGYELLARLQSTDVLSVVANKLCSVEPGDMEFAACLSFLSMFTRADTTRQLLAGRTEGLIVGVLKLLDTKFESATPSFQASLLIVKTNLHGRNVQTDSTNAKLFIANDGLRIVNKALKANYEQAKKIVRTRAFTADELNVVKLGMPSLGSVCAVLAQFNFSADSSLAKEKYTYTTEGILAVTAILHSFFTLSNSARFGEAAISTFANFSQFLCARHRDLLKSVLFFNADTDPPSAFFGVPLVTQFLRLSRGPAHMHLNEVVRTVCESFMHLLPSIADLVVVERPELFTRLSAAVAPNIAVCGFPGCFLNVNNCTLKQCARCHTVSYCGKEHQLAHWKEHKKCCKHK